ncbi:MAG: sigma-70 family RNA polymerase sigma factor [Ignavibacterium sp.]|nr:sigma-70 family RNA polymerase sigma factor [Ignavibacterium sp.]
MKIGKNDLTAFELFYKRYSSLVYTVSLKILGNKESAERNLAEIFLIVWKWAEDFDFVVQNVFTWMVLLTRNKAIDSLRRFKGNGTLPIYNDEHEIKYILPKLSIEIESLEREYILKLSENIKNIIDSLNDEQKDLFFMVYYEGLDEKAIAEKLKIPVAALKLQIQYIIEILMQKIIR